MTDASWKASERAIAHILGGERVPVSGRGRGDAPDVEHPSLSIEVKCRASLPAWLLDALRQAGAASRGERIPVVVLHRHGARHADAPAVLRLGDLAALLVGDTARPADEPAAAAERRPATARIGRQTPADRGGPVARKATKSYARGRATGASGGAGC